MIDLTNCKSLNDIARQEFGKANYTNREKCKKILFNEGINWEEWLESVKEIKPKKYCLYCGKELNTRRQTKFCCSSHAAKYNNSNRELSEDIRIKISHSLQKKAPNFSGEFKPLTLRSKTSIIDKFGSEKRYCKNCGKELSGRKIHFCNQHCQQEYQHNQYIERWKNGEEDGIKGEYGLSKHIRRYLLEKTGYKCEKCGWGEENPHTHTIPLEIHHIDGDYTNNKEENLQVLCPNHHSLTETHKSHNKSGRVGRKKYYTN